jgi:hypothetical protein
MILLHIWINSRFYVKSSFLALNIQGPLFLEFNSKIKLGDRQREGRKIKRYSKYR